jgi:hypothetical protein
LLTSNWVADIVRACEAAAMNMMVNGGTWKRLSTRADIVQADTLAPVLALRQFGVIHQELRIVDMPESLARCGNAPINTSA